MGALAESTPTVRLEEEVERVLMAEAQKELQQCIQYLDDTEWMYE